MQNFRIFRSLGILLIGTSLLANAQDKAQDKASIQQKLTSHYALTKTTADKTDIVTAGAILVLKKDNLRMDAISSNLFQNTYKDGKIIQSVLAKMFRLQMTGNPIAPFKEGTPRTFVTGEKMWVTNIEVKDNGVNVELYTDAIKGVRYRAVLSFPFKGSSPIAEQAGKMVAEVFDVQAADDSGANGQGQQAPANGQQQPPADGQPQQAEAPPPPIPSPPPPADEPPAPPKTVSLGQTVDVVVANFGQPEKIADLGTKQIYYYKDIKVTFLKGKVTDVQ